MVWVAVRLLVLTVCLSTTVAFTFPPIWNAGYYEDDDGPSDYQVWSAITTSLVRWRDRKLRRIRRSTHRVQRRDEEEVCYQNFGCFRDEGPFDYLDALPAPPEEIGTSFTLYTRKNVLEGDHLDYDNTSSLYYSHFNGSNPIKIIVHGFGGSGKRPWVKQMTEILLYTGDMNIIVVDWEKGAALPHYVQAAANTQLVGKQIARLIQMINYERGTTSKDFHIIGFSLGAHVAGFTGQEVKNLSRITGLDPASPLFENYDPRVRLDPADATFVDVIHSNGDSFYKGGLGVYEPLGHVDFYPNGGRVQLGCNNVFVGAISDLFYVGKWQSLCNHRRAFRLFIDSIVPACSFPAFSCDSYEKFLQGECFSCGDGGKNCSSMGYYADKTNGRGKMYLVTRENEPFCSNQHKIMLSSSKGQGTTWGRIEVTFYGGDKVNETFVLSRESDEIPEEGIIQGIVVAHPDIHNLTHVSLKYTQYRGWIYSGLESWSFDKILIVNSHGESFSYCGYGTKVDTDMPLKLGLVRGDCKVQMPLPTQRLARLIWQVVGEPVVGPAPQPPKLMWNILLMNNEPAYNQWQNL